MLLADSSAVSEKERVLAQHQAALSVMKIGLENPQLAEYFWLDLACGKGQIIAHLDEIFPQDLREKILYYAYDIQVKYVTIAEQRASALKMKSVQAKSGDLADFSDHCFSDIRFDFITFTNTVHETDPNILIPLLVELILRLKPNGQLFIYDMEKLPEPELGAISWIGKEFEQIILVLLETLGVKDYKPSSSKWQHTNIQGWSMSVQRQFVSVSDEYIRSKQADTTQQAALKMQELLNRKYRECSTILESLTRYEPQTPEEAQSKIHELYKFWALARAVKKT